MTGRRLSRRRAWRFCGAGLGERPSVLEFASVGARGPLSLAGAGGRARDRRARRGRYGCSCGVQYHSRRTRWRFAILLFRRCYLQVRRPTRLEAPQCADRTAWRCTPVRPRRRPAGCPTAQCGHRATRPGLSAVATVGTPGGRVHARSKTGCGTTADRTGGGRAGPGRGSGRGGGRRRRDSRESASESRARPPQAATSTATGPNDNHETNYSASAGTALLGPPSCTPSALVRLSRQAAGSRRHCMRVSSIVGRKLATSGP